MPNRIYFKKSIVELEELYSQNSTNHVELKKILDELKHRKTQRASKLESLIEGNIQNSSNFKPKEPYVATPTPRVIETPKTNSEKGNDHITTLASSERERVVLNELPEVTNKPSSILDSWTALEVLSPPSFSKPEDLTSGDKSRIISLGSSTLPWQRDDIKSRKNYRLYYQIILGTIDMPKSMAALLKIYTDKREERPEGKGEAVIASITVDKDGVPIEEDSASIASFAWGTPIALSGDLETLGKWKTEEKRITEELSNLLNVLDNNDEPRSLTITDINNAYCWIVNKLDIPSDFVKPPQIIIKTFQYFKNKEPPESILLNSFYLDDLSLAKKSFSSNKASLNLNKYLGAKQPEKRISLMENAENAISGILEPQKFPLGSWPANGRFPLALLQQCAVNLTSQNLNDTGMLAVNGPPGTGKTTLLRDIG